MKQAKKRKVEESKGNGEVPQPTEPLPEAEKEKKEHPANSPLVQ